MSFGLILDAVHSREGCYLYLKEVEEGRHQDVLLAEKSRGSLSRRLDMSSARRFQEQVTAAMCVRAEREKKSQVPVSSFH